MAQDCTRSCSGRTAVVRVEEVVRVSGRRSSGSFGSDRTAGYAIGEERTSPWLEAIAGIRERSYPNELGSKPVPAPRTRSDYTYRSTYYCYVISSPSNNLSHEASVTTSLTTSLTHRPRAGVEASTHSAFRRLSYAQIPPRPSFRFKVPLEFLISNCARHLNRTRRPHTMSERRRHHADVHPRHHLPDT
eukprot:scaffold48885_cov56-Phaeocystis_antarctica.AAC.2